MPRRFSVKTILCLLVALMACSAGPSRAQTRDLAEEMRERAALLYHQQRIEAFIEDVNEFFEVSGELVSFRVHPNMTASELEMIEDQSRDLDDKAGDLITFIRYIVPATRGKTDDLWVLQLPNEDSTLEYRLTLILALVFRIEPKLTHLIEALTEEREPAIEVDELIVEAYLPYFIAGGLEEIRSLTRELRRFL